MEKSLMLLPFVHGIDGPALSCALTFAQERDATLLLVSLIPLPKGARRQGIRAEAIAQVYDFFELMAYKAARIGVTIKCIHLATPQVARSIQGLAKEMACTGILLFVRDGTGVLLETEDIKQLLEQETQLLYIFRLVSGTDQLLQCGVSCILWLRSFLKNHFLYRRRL